MSGQSARSQRTVLLGIVFLIAALVVTSALLSRFDLPWWAHVLIMSGVGLGCGALFAVGSRSGSPQTRSPEATARPESDGTLRSS